MQSRLISSNFYTSQTQAVHRSIEQLPLCNQSANMERTTRSHQDLAWGSWGRTCESQTQAQSIWTCAPFIRAPMRSHWKWVQHLHWIYIYRQIYTYYCAPRPSCGQGAVQTPSYVASQNIWWSSKRKKFWLWMLRWQGNGSATWLLSIVSVHGQHVQQTSGTIMSPCFLAFVCCLMAEAHFLHQHALSHRFSSSLSKSLKSFARARNSIQHPMRPLFCRCQSSSHQTTPEAVDSWRMLKARSNVISGN